MPSVPSLPFRIILPSWRGVALRSEAIASLALAATVVRLLPFRRAIRFGSRSALKGERHISIDELRRISRHVETAARFVPWRTVCLQQGLALQWMLRRRGVDSRLHYGIAKDELAGLSAHVWVSAGRTPLVGSEQAPSFTVVATFPS